MSARKSRVPDAPPTWIVDGAKARYHAVIDGPATKDVIVRGAPFQSNAGQTWCVFVDGVRGYVACDALSGAQS